ncbi:MAG: ABC transporter ATP-binding protein [Phycicoccus sp.]
MTAAGTSNRSAIEALGLVGLYKWFGSTAVIENLSLAVDAGEVVALVGPNGSGKSTLLECVAGAVPFERGSVRVMGRVSDPSSSAHWRAVYGILDDFTWLPDLTVVDHLLLMSPDADPARATAALRRFGVERLGNRDPSSLSAGQRQRAALATACVRPWQVLLLDEPERHLDATGVEVLARELAALATGGRCVVLASHSVDLVTRLGCRVVDLGAQDRA